MANLSGTDISASVSTKGLTAGRHQVRPNVTLPPEVQWLRTEPEIVVVNLQRDIATPTTRVAARGGLLATPTR
jgi:hypothetical protein